MAEAEIIIGVHSATRPVERAVASLLRNTREVRVTVIAHNLAPEAILTRLGDLAKDSRVRVLPLADGVRSPANAFNFGLDNAVAGYVGLLGSDDELADGALDAWLTLAERHDADVVIAPIRRVESGAVPSPRVRPGRTHHLDGDRDRLFERTAPLGLWRREKFDSLRFTEGLPRGVDQSFGLHLWFGAASIVFDPASPPYLEHDDQGDRVTKVVGPAADDLAYLDAIESDPVFTRMSADAKRAVAAKILRVHVIASIQTHIRAEGLAAADRATFAAVWKRLDGWAPGVGGILAVRDVRVLREAVKSTATEASLRAAVGDRSRFLTFDALMPANPLRVLHRHAPFRSLFGGRRVAKTVNAVVR
ncbi:MULTISPECIES: glycosyltransferase [unclassified Microbacterium]|uniref:glycosyltransferase n=1 Tax=unclassified Microbacterium TaxID=2609290 RepID=UPI000EAA7F17|nr:MULTISPECIES: glycosyltransferase [unclassified Microbacterium]MBT2485397.1 glycosyltransferase [Microbacterium sp. ISL-108]RKN68200.1 glycosyltransferase [Microbacterium sp. CGR2]